jgi:Chromo (CHRromatin Organisation MOdifier) domain
MSDYDRKKFPCSKLAPRWSDPCEVVKVLKNGVTYVVRRDENEESVHVSRLLPLSSQFWDEPPREEKGAPEPERRDHEGEYEDEELGIPTIEVTRRYTAARPEVGVQPEVSVQPEVVPSPSPSSVGSLDSDEFIVEKIVSSRKAPQGGFVYRVRWKDYSEAADTWESQENLSRNCQDLVDNYETTRAALGWRRCRKLG